MSPEFEVLATGNSGQTFTADIALKGFSVRPKKIIPEFCGSDPNHDSLL